MFGMDWTYDMFFEDSTKYDATPMKGVYPNPKASDREKFMTWFKNLARDFRAEWHKAGLNDYDRFYGYIGDAFINSLHESIFSDYYKDVYGQRPHLDSWFYVRVLDDMPTGSDVIYTFCANPIRDAIQEAKEVREQVI